MVRAAAAAHPVALTNESEKDDETELVDRARRLEEALARLRDTSSNYDEDSSVLKMQRENEDVEEVKLDDDDVVDEPCVPLPPRRDRLVELGFEGCMDAGRLAFGRADHKSSLECFESAYRIVETSHDKDPLKLARAEANMANVYSAIQLHYRALAVVKSALLRLRAVAGGNNADEVKRVQCFVLSNAVLFSVRLGKLDEALGFAVRKLACADNAEDRAEAEHWIDHLNQKIEARLPGDASSSSSPRA